VPTEGTVAIDGTRISSLNAEQRAAVRRRDVGSVFQSDNLLPFLTADENVGVQQAMRTGETDDRSARDVLVRAGLHDEAARIPDELSGGQRQRVAVARALAGQPRLLVADEPTGSLDPDTAETVVDLLLGTVHTSGATLVLVTHEPSVAERLDRVITLRDGRVIADQSRRAP
jgi:putative ABC transport system ATP-binding protein